MRPSTLDSIKKYRVFGEIIETTEQSKNPYLIPSKKKGKWGYVNYKSEFVIPAKYDSAGLFWDDKTYGTIAVVKSKGETRYINKAGDVTEGPSPPRQDYFRLSKMIRKAIYKNLRDLDRANHFVEHEGKYGFKNQRDTIIPIVYENFGFLDGDLLTMKNANGWVLLDTVGTILTHAFDTIMHYSNRHFTIVRNGDRYRMIDRRGNYMGNADYDELHYVDCDAMAIIYKEKNRYGLLNLKGEIIVKARYRWVHPYTHYYNRCFLFSRRKGHLVYIDGYGKQYNN